MPIRVRPRKSESRQDFISRCMGHDKLLAEFPEQDKRMAVCSGIWDKHKTNSSDSRRILTLSVQPDIEAIRTETFNGTDHLVVPLVAITEGVLWPSNAESPELALASEFGKYPQSWDGRPVVMGHPLRDGTPVSANSPDVLANESFGQLFNTELDGKKLKTEAWIDLNRVETLGGDIEATVERLQSGDEMVEVSTGVFVTLEGEVGVFKGNKFDGVWRSVAPDHLALLPEGVKGACSVEDGAGAPRLNEEQNPGGGEVGAIFSEELVASENFFPAIEGVLSPKYKSTALLASQLITNSISDEDTRVALEAALAQTLEWFWIVAVFEDTVVYSAGLALFQRSYKIEENGAITVGEESTQVRPETEFVPVIVQESNMTKAERVSALIANEATQFGDTDQEWLLTLDEAQLGKLEPVINKEPVENTEVTPTAEATVEVTPTAEVTANEQVVTPVVPVAPKTAGEYIAAAPQEIQEVLGEGLRLQQHRRTQLVQGLLANDACTFDQASLGKMDLATLEKMALLAQVPSFEGQGAAELLTVSDEYTVDEPPAMFAVGSK